MKPNIFQKIFIFFQLIATRFFLKDVLRILNILILLIFVKKSLKIIYMKIDLLKFVYMNIDLLKIFKKMNKNFTQMIVMSVNVKKVLN